MEYDKYYQTQNLFGKAYPELIDFYASIENKSKLLDLGCGQGRDAIPLARMGFSVTGVDHSKVGIDQLNQITEKENLPLMGVVADVYSYSGFDAFDYILLDSMFHFNKTDIEKEKNFINKIIHQSSTDTVITICIQNTGKKVQILEELVSRNSKVKMINQIDLVYTFVDTTSNHSSKTPYQMISIKRL